MIRIASVLLLTSCADLIGITDERELSMVALTVSTGVLEPAFDPAIAEYDVTVGHPNEAVEVHAEANDPLATIVIAGMQSVEGSLGVALPVGDTTIDITANTPSGVTVGYKVRVHRADLAIAFAAPRAVPTQVSGMIDRVTVADFDGNGTDDLGVIVGFGEVGILTNNGIAQFVPKFMFPFPNTRAIAAHDLDGDGKPELIVTANQVQIARGYGDGMFEGPFMNGATVTPGAFSFVQLDADGKTDLVVAEQNGRLAVFGGGPPGTTSLTPLPALDQITGPHELTAVVSGELDAMPGEDVASLDPISRKIYVHRNLGGALGFEAIDLGFGAQPVELIVADLDGDLRAELVWIDRATDSIVVQPFPGPRRSTHHVVGKPRSLSAIDVDGDGVRDLIVLDDQGVTVLHNDGTGTLFQKSIPIALPGVQRLAVGDFNGDGRADLVTCNFTSTVLVHLGTP